MSDPKLAHTCSKCGYIHASEFKFCTKCGQRNSITVKKEKAKDKDFQKNLQYLSVFSVISIILLLVAKFTEETFEVLLIWTVCFALINLIFAILQPPVWALLNFKSVKLLPLLSIMAIAISTGIIVSISIDHLNQLLFGEPIGYMHYFKDRENPLLYGILLIAVCPALSEELAYRGFVYNNLQKLGGTKSAILGSSFLFGLIHFSLLSLVWLIPFALLLAYFRNKYSTMIYGIIGHFIHNATAICIEYFIEF